MCTNLKSTCVYLNTPSSARKYSQKRHQCINNSTSGEAIPTILSCYANFLNI